jgi:hypothetical protein
MARPPRRRSHQPRLTNPDSPTQSGLLKMAAQRLCPEITHALAGLHYRGGAWTGACPHAPPPVAPANGARTPQLLPATISENLAHEARSMDPD